MPSFQSELPRALLLFILVIRPFHILFSSSSSSSPLPSSSAEPWNREVFSVAGPPGTASAPKALLQWRSCWVPTRNTRSVQRSSWGSGWLSKQDAIWNLQGSHCLQDGSARVPAEKDVAVMPDLVETMVVSASDCLCRHGRPKMRLVADLKPAFLLQSLATTGFDLSYSFESVLPGGVSESRESSPWRLESLGCRSLGKVLQSRNTCDP